jgi:hypothetical protein
MSTSYMDSSGICNFGYLALIAVMAKETATRAVYDGT